MEIPRNHLEYGVKPLKFIQTGKENYNSQHRNVNVTVLYFFITKIFCLFYCFSTFLLSEHRKVRLIRAFSPAGRKIWFERGGTVTPGFG